MKNIFKTSVFALAAAALFSACSNDEPAPGNGGNTDQQEGLTAYLQVNVRATDGQTGRGSDEGYVNGDATEHTVNNAKFFFFDNNGLFVLEASVWDGGNATNNGNGNIEYIGKNVLVLEGLDSNQSPTYMLTVLNAPDGFTPGATIAETRNKLMGITSAGSFVMSTSSYFDANNDQFGTTKLKPGDFQIQKPGEAMPSTFETVNVYVERLAAKVQVNLAATASKTINGVKYFKINASVGGENNDEGDKNEGVTELYAVLNTWGINGTAQNSYLSKDISGFNLDTNSPFSGWNKANDFRSFWGKSVVYGNSSPALNYLGYAGTDVAFGSSAYCAENTNTASAIAKADAANLLLDKNVTSVIFAANVVAIDESNNVTYPDLVRFNGVLYTYDQFFAYALNNLNAQNKLNYWKKVGDEYKQLSVDDLLLALEATPNKGTGSVNITTGLKSGSFFVKEGDSFNSADWDADAISDLKTKLLNFYNAQESVGNAYAGGAMFYSVPIEHLVSRADAADDLVEGNYGVVRNHWYQINVNTVTTLGHGVFDPGTGEDEGEPLIPEDPRDPSYFLGATINVLSWKVVSQNVGI